MNVTEITAIITSICTVLTVLVVFVGKKYLEITIQKIAETEAARKLAYESEMGKITAVSETIENNTRVIESIKRDIDISKITYQIKYSKLHERRMVVIEETYSKVITLNISLQDYMAPFQQSKSGKQEDFEAEQKKKQQKAFDSFQDLNLFYHNKKLFFDQSTKEKMEQLLKIVRDKIWDFTGPDRMKSYGIEHKDLKDEYKKRSDASDYIFDEIPKMLDALEKELQKVLGID
jgi:hypothetical protein